MRGLSLDLAGADSVDVGLLRSARCRRRRALAGVPGGADGLPGNGIGDQLRDDRGVLAVRHSAIERGQLAQFKGAAERSLFKLVDCRVAENSAAFEVVTAGKSGGNFVEVSRLFLLRLLRVFALGFFDDVRGFGDRDRLARLGTLYDLVDG